MLLERLLLSFPVRSMSHCRCSVSAWSAAFVLCWRVHAFPAVATALEANAIVASIAFKHSDALHAPPAEIAVVKLKAALHELLFPRQDLVTLLDEFIPLGYGPDECYEFTELPLQVAFLLAF